VKAFSALIFISMIFINACSSNGGGTSRVITIADVGGHPDGVTVADSGNIYITDIESGEIIQISPDGVIDIVADIEGHQMMVI